MRTKYRVMNILSVIVLTAVPVSFVPRPHPNPRGEGRVTSGLIPLDSLKTHS